MIHPHRFKPPAYVSDVSRFALGVQSHYTCQTDSLDSKAYWLLQRSLADTGSPLSTSSLACKLSLGIGLSYDEVIWLKWELEEERVGLDTLISGSLDNASQFNLAPLKWNLLGGESALSWVNSVLRSLMGEVVFYYYQQTGGCFPGVPVSFSEPKSEFSEPFREDAIDEFAFRLQQKVGRVFDDRIASVQRTLDDSGSLDGFTSALPASWEPTDELADELADALTLVELSGVLDAQRHLEAEGFTSFTENDPYRLPFEEAIAYFQERISLPIDPDLIRSEWHNYAFFVSGVTDAKLLANFRELTEEAIASGISYEEFLEGFTEIAEASGWQPKEGISRRSKMVFDANLRQAYSFGQIQQYTRPEVLDEYPSWEWRHRDSRNPRKHHKTMDGKLFPASENPPLALPSGFGCRCRWLPRREAPTEAFRYTDVQNPRTGETERTPALEVDGKLTPLADPGWRPPSTRQRLEVRQSLIDSLPGDLAQKVSETEP